MSDTPRTDAAECAPHVAEDWAVDFARGLERDVRDILNGLEAKIGAVRSAYNNAAYMRCERLMGTLEDLEWEMSCAVDKFEKWAKESSHHPTVNPGNFGSGDSSSPPPSDALWSRFDRGDGGIETP
jgi:hypothetical protein